MKRLNKILLILVLGLFISIKSVFAVEIESISIAEGFMNNYLVGDKFQLHVNYNPTNDIDKNITWKSYTYDEYTGVRTEDSSVVSVDSNGNVLVLKEGIAGVEATSVNGKTAEYYIISTNKPIVSLSSNSGNLEYGNSTKLNYYVVPSNTKVSFKVADTSIASVDANGNITAKKEGSTKVYVTASNGNTDTYNLTVIKKNISSLSVASVSKRTYLGHKIKPAVTVKHGNYTLKEGKDYTLYYSNNLYPGKATIKIVGKGKYTGTKYTNFNIVPAKTYISYGKSLSKHKITIKYPKRVGASGYKIAYRKKGTSKWNYIYTSKTKYTISGLSSKKYYQIKVIPYKNIDGKKEDAYNYSKIKTVKVK